MCVKVIVVLLAMFVVFGQGSLCGVKDGRKCRCLDGGREVYCMNSGYVKVPVISDEYKERVISLVLRGNLIEELWDGDIVLMKVLRLLDLRVQRSADCVVDRRVFRNRRLHVLGLCSYKVCTLHGNFHI
jgi:hypothetical protein